MRGGGEKKKDNGGEKKKGRLLLLCLLGSSACESWRLARSSRAAGLFNRSRCCGCFQGFLEGSSLASPASGSGWGASSGNMILVPEQQKGTHCGDEP